MDIDRTVQMIDLRTPQSVEIVYNGNTLWINVDGVCRLRIVKVSRDILDASSLYFLLTEK